MTPVERSGPTVASLEKLDTNINGGVYSGEIIRKVNTFHVSLQGLGVESSHRQEVETLLKAAWGTVSSG